MEVREAIRLKAVLIHDVGKLLREFTEKTGLDVEEISIDHVRQIGQRSHITNIEIKTVI